ncbi:MAG: prepilin peptidase [Blautia sp.]|nr:prepilin peptidase [Blautia sp.]
MSLDSFLLLFISGTAMIMDLTFSGIDNEWILFSFFSGILWQVWMRGPSGGILAVSGAASALSVLFLLFVFSMLGAGDIKLFCSLGTILGPSGILKCIAGSFFTGAVISLFILVTRQITYIRFRYAFQYLNECIRTRRVIPYRKHGMEHPENIHFTIPIFLYLLLFVS